MESDFVDSDFYTGNAISSLCKGCAVPISSFTAVPNVVFSSSDVSRPVSFGLSDDFVYRIAYININGTGWRQFNVTGSMLAGPWVVGSATGSYNIPASLVSVGNSSKNYIAVYSCKRAAPWDCHDGWQIRSFTTTKTIEGFGKPINSGTAESTLLAGVPIIHAQTFVIPENAVSGDTVGDLNLMWKGNSQAVTFSLTNNDGGRFSINSDGRISVAAASALSFDFDTQQQRQITVRATETSTGKYNDAIITIKLSRTEDTVFIDPTWTGCENGNRSCPYNSWSDVTFATSRTYLQKRGTVSRTGITVTADGISSKHLIVGAYGYGNRPDIDCSSTPDARAIFLGSGYNHDGSDAANYVDIYSFSAHGCNGIRDSYASKHLIFRDIIVHHSFDNGGIYIWQDLNSQAFNGAASQSMDNLDILIEDVVAHDMGTAERRTHGIKCQGGGVTVRNLLTYNNVAHGISFPSESAYNTIEYVISYNNNGGVEIGSDYTTLKYALSHDNYHGIWINDNAPYVNVSNSDVNNNYAYGIVVEQGTSNVFIENTKVYNNDAGGIRIRDNCSYLYLRNNRIYSNNNAGVSIGRSDATHTVYPSYVRIYDNHIFNNPLGIQAEFGNNIFITNNKFCNNNRDVSVSSSAVSVTQSGNNISTDCSSTINPENKKENDTILVNAAKIIGVWASSYEPDSAYYPSKTLDNDLSETSRWSAFGDGEWITYALNQTTSVSYVRIAFYYSTQRYFDIQYSTNNVTWYNTSAVRLTSAANMASQYQTFTFTPVAAKYIRIVGHGSSYPSLWNSIVETDINGFAASLSSGDVVTQPYCGDGNCNNNENCSTCTNDCGACSNSGGSNIFNIYFKQDFQHRTAGIYTKDKMQADWNNAANSLTTEKVYIEDENGNKIMKNYLDAGKFGLSQSGVDWYMTLPDKTQDELYYNYRMKFSDNIATEYTVSKYGESYPYPDHWLSGKAGQGFYTNMNGWPAAGNKPEPSNKAFFVLLMFDGGRSSTHDKVQMKFYEYDLNMVCGAPAPNCWGNSYPIDYDFSPNTWYDVTARIVLNDPGKNNGILEYFVNGKLVASFTNFRFRDYSDVKINMIDMSNFFGGSGTVPQRDGWFAYDDITVFNYNQNAMNIPRGTTPSQAGRVLILPGTTTTNVCVPASRDITCSGKICGTVTNNCNQAVTCDLTTTCNECTTDAQCNDNVAATSDTCTGTPKRCSHSSTNIASNATYQQVVNNPNLKILYKNNFEQRPLGKYETRAEFISDWQSVSGWGDRGELFEVVSDTSSSANKVGKFTFPYYDSDTFKWLCWSGQGCSDSEGRRIYFSSEPQVSGSISQLQGVGPGSGGGQWFVDLKGDYNDVYLLYSLRFSPNFDAVNGGKLFGVYGEGDISCGACQSSDCNSDGIADSFVSKHMFHKNSISYYVYHFDKVNVCGDSMSVSNTAKLYDGNWHTILLHTHMNDVNSYNGLIETWIDGEKQNSYSNLRFRVGQNNFGIQQIGITTFFGGSGDDRCYEAKYSTQCGKNIAPYFFHGCDKPNSGLDAGWCEGLKSCVKNVSDPCSDILRYKDGTPFLTFAPRKTEYLYVDNIVAYTSK
jgi:hypothetical protein